MALSILLSEGERILINGVVITVGEKRGKIQLLLHNKADFIPSKYIMQGEAVSTPLRELYFSVQVAYISIKDEKEYARLYREAEACFTKVILATAHQQSRDSLLESQELFQKGDHFGALRILRKLVELEASLLAELGHELPPAFSARRSGGDMSDGEGATE